MRHLLWGHQGAEEAARKTGSRGPPCRLAAPSTPSLPHFHPSAPTPLPAPCAPSSPCHPDSQPTLRPSGWGAEDGRGGSRAPRRGPGLGGRRTPTLGAAGCRETTRPRLSAKADGGRSRAVKGRYLVAGAMVLLHGGASSPRGLRDGQV